MTEKTYKTPCGVIHYWVSGIREGRTALVLLPGLTADHRLFDKQVERFESDYGILVWDAPGHSASYPFSLDFSLLDKARWLNDILCAEGIDAPVIIGQSMGGYVGQAYAQLYPDRLMGFVAIDSAPLQRRYMSSWELWLLKRLQPMYMLFPWSVLLSAGSRGVSATEYGTALMREMMMVYDGDKRRYARLSGHGFKILAEAVEAELPYGIACPALLICGEKDRAGFCVRYNKAWHRDTGIRLEWIKGAGHNSNTDRPDEVNALIEELLREVKP